MKYIFIFILASLPFSGHSQNFLTSINTEAIEEIGFQSQNLKLENFSFMFFRHKEDYIRRFRLVDFKLDLDNGHERSNNLDMDREFINCNDVLFKIAFGKEYRVPLTKQLNLIYGYDHRMGLSMHQQSSRRTKKYFYTISRKYTQNATYGINGVFGLSYQYNSFVIGVELRPYIEGTISYTKKRDIQESWNYEGEIQLSNDDKSHKFDLQIDGLSNWYTPIFRASYQF